MSRPSAAPIARRSAARLKMLATSSISTAIDATNVVAKAGVDHIDAVRAFIDQAKGLTQLTATHSSSLEQAINKLPGFLSASTPALADLDNAAAQYRQTVLAAMQDVADTLRALEADARNLRAEAVAEDLAAKSLEISKKQFAAGGISHVQLLIVERQYSQAHQNRVLAEAARYSDSAALYQALGGGWWNRKDQEKVTKQ